MASNTVEETTQKPDVSGSRIRSQSSKAPTGQIPNGLEEPSSCSAGPLHYLSYITVEPAVFLQLMCYGMEQVFKTNMILDKTCSIQLHYSKAICDDLNSGKYVKEQDTVQKITNNYTLYCLWIEYLPAVFMMVLLGAWSDTYGRKLPLIFSMAGSTLKVLGLVLNAYWWTLQPFYILLSYIPYGLCGNLMATLMAAYAYIGENSGERLRTTRLSILSIMFYTSVPAGQAAAMYFYNCGGYVMVFGVEFLFSLLSVLYALVRIKNKRPKRSVEDSEPSEQRSVLSLAGVKKSLLVVFKERENGGRAQVLGHICCVCLYVVSAGALNFLYMYTRKKFQWSYYKFTVWSVCSTPLSLLGSCALLPLLSYYWRVEDGVIGFIGGASQVMFGVLVGTAPVPWVLYLALIALSCSSMISTASRSALSKLVDSDELGAVYSVAGIGEGILPIFTSLMYTAIYNSTLDVFPGAIFTLNSSITLIICFIHVWILTSFDPPKVRKSEATLCPSDA